MSVAKCLLVGALMLPAIGQSVAEEVNTSEEAIVTNPTVVAGGIAQTPIEDFDNEGIPAGALAAGGFAAAALAGIIVAATGNDSGPGEAPPAFSTTPSTTN